MSCETDSHHTISDDQKNEKDIAALHNEILIPEFPEGGLRAWLVVLGSFSALFSTWGVVNSYVLHPSFSTTD